METSGTTEEVTVLIVEDHEGVRAAMRAILEAAAGIQVVGEAAEGPNAVQLTQQKHPDVLLLDLDVEVFSGEIEVGAVLRQFPKTRVVILTSYDDTQYARGFLEQGAAGCMLKDDVPRSLVQAVRAVSLNQAATWVSPRLA